jgi:hypothetical protein
MAPLLLTTGLALAQSHAGVPEDVLEPVRHYSPYVERKVVDENFAEGVYWGDTHLHTSYSTDAGMMGNTLGPDVAYRFARGEEVISSHGWIFWWSQTMPRTSGWRPSLPSPIPNC